MSRDVEVLMGMPDHDPRCPQASLQPVRSALASLCLCDLIDTVRQDEQAEMNVQAEQEFGYRRALRDAVDAVRGIDSCPECSIDEAVAAIKGLCGERCD